MKAARIRRNSTPTGAVFVKSTPQSLFLNDGTITGNCAHDGAGGGVAVMDELPTEEHGTAFTMNGGTISNNTASGYRCWRRHLLLLELCLFAGRTNREQLRLRWRRRATVRAIPKSIRPCIQNALITGNTADQGGGLWFCPTGDAKLYMQNGAVIYGNTAASAGDDFASPEVAIGAGGNGGVTLPDYFSQWQSDPVVQRRLPVRSRWKSRYIRAGNPIQYG